jgi:exodeoxyribonuclease VII large subunit
MASGVVRLVMKETESKLLSLLSTESRILSVSELTRAIKDTLESEFYSLQVQGEITNYKRHHSGHWYLTLKDHSAQLRGVFFKQWNRLLRFEPENGLEVRVRGRLGLYEPRGEYQIMIETMEPVGVGALQIAFEQQVKRLSAEGLFDPARKRSLPLFPKKIGLVTSPVGAALRDMLQILERRNRGIDILITPVRVQGTGAAREIADAIRLLNQYSEQSEEPLDVLIVGRGGGSMEDLWAFNEEPVARAIFESKIPIVSAVGHETDLTIADLVADLRAPTPSAAAEMVAVESNQLLARIDELQKSLVRAMSYDLLKRRSRLRELIASRGFTDTTATIQSLLMRTREFEARLGRALSANLLQARRRFEGLEQRVSAIDFRAFIAAGASDLTTLNQRGDRAIERRLETAGRRLAVAVSKLDALSPLSVLSRGYVIVKDRQGRPVTHAHNTKKGQDLTLKFDDGEVDCQVK